LEERTIYLENQDNEDEDLGFLKMKLKLVPLSFEFNMVKELEQMKLDQTVFEVQSQSHSRVIHQSPNIQCVLPIKEF
jgi:c-di-GMP-binding flagellar brake protein YcgR